MTGAKRKGKKNGYAKRLASPKWQRKRLEKMQESDFACDWCANKSEELQIHHGYYSKNRDGSKREPHEYPADTLWTLCDSCHEKAEAARTTVYYELAKIHPRHHWEVRRLLIEVQKQIEADPDELKNQGIVTED